MAEFHFRAMGCRILAIVEAESEAALATLRALPDLFDAWEQALSRFRDDSELTRLNRHPGQPVPVSSVLWEVLRLSLAVAERTDGLVTPTVLGALEAAGYDRSFDILERTAQDASPSLGDGPVPSIPVPDWRAIQLDAATRSVVVPVGTRLDLGGVAKGWAAEQAVALLAAHGPALVDAGGDIVVRGPRRDGTPWLIGVADPFVEEHDLALIALSSGAVATSGRDYRRWQRYGRHFHHVIDPRTGQPAETDVLTATAVAPTGWEAEMVAKVALLLGSRAGIEWVERYPASAVLLVVEEPRPAVILSSRMVQYLASEPRLA